MGCRYILANIPKDMRGRKSLCDNCPASLDCLDDGEPRSDSFIDIKTTEPVSAAPTPQKLEQKPKRKYTRRVKTPLGSIHIDDLPPESKKNIEAGIKEPAIPPCPPELIPVLQAAIPAPVNTNRVLVDLQRSPELCEWLFRMAEEDDRNPDQEVLALLKYAKLTYKGQLAMITEART